MPRTRSVSPLRGHESFFRWHSRRPSSNISNLPKDLDKLEEDSTVAQLSADASRMRREVQTLHERNTQLEFENLSLREDVDAVQEMLKSTEMSKAELDQQLDGFTSTINKLQEEKLTIMRKAEASAYESAEMQKSLENYIEVLTEELQQVTNEAEAKHSRKARTNSFAIQGPCSSCRMYRQDLKASYEVQRSLEAELAQLRAQVEEARERLQDAEAELEIQRENNTVYKEEQEGLAMATNQVISKLPASIQRESAITNNLQANLQFLARNVGFMTMQLMAYEDDCEVLKMELATKSSQVARLSEYSDFLKKEKNNVVKVWKLQGRVKELEAEVQVKEKRIRELSRQGTARPWDNPGWVPSAQRKKRGVSGSSAGRGQGAQPDSLEMSRCHSRQHSTPGSPHGGGGASSARSVGPQQGGAMHSKHGSYGVHGSYYDEEHDDRHGQGQLTHRAHEQYTQYRAPPPPPQPAAAAAGPSAAASAATTTTTTTTTTAGYSGKVPPYAGPNQAKSRPATAAVQQQQQQPPTTCQVIGKPRAVASHPAAVPPLPLPKYGTSKAGGGVHIPPLATSSHHATAAPAAAKPAASMAPESFPAKQQTQQQLLQPQQQPQHHKQHSVALQQHHHHKQRSITVVAIPASAGVRQVVASAGVPPQSNGTKPKKVLNKPRPAWKDFFTRVASSARL